LELNASDVSNARSIHRLIAAFYAYSTAIILYVMQHYTPG
jgi:hypothetical protein